MLTPTVEKVHRNNKNKQDQQYWQNSMKRPNINPAIMKLSKLNHWPQVFKKAAVLKGLGAIAPCKYG